ncbi:MAG: nitroreductase [Desulfobacterium sp.]|nr:nitroreductase [Desulfobacterium sp.]
MDITEAIKTRKSIRKFKTDPVPREIIREILETSVRAPSAENTQPWEFVVLGGTVLENIKKANVEKIRNYELPPKEMEHLMVTRPKDSIYRKRQVEIGMKLFELMGIAREDKEKRAAWLERGFRYFDAPVAIIITMDSALPELGAFLDIGMVTQNICLAALKYGLHTCIENQGVTYSDAIRKYADIPESTKPVVSIALGYPDWDFPANRIESEREPIDNTVLWRM